MKWHVWGGGPLHLSKFKIMLIINSVTFSSLHFFRNLEQHCGEVQRTVSTYCCLVCYLLLLLPRNPTHFMLQVISCQQYLKCKTVVVWWKKCYLTRILKNIWRRCWYILICYNKVHFMVDVHSKAIESELKKVSNFAFSYSSIVPCAYFRIVT